MAAAQCVRTAQRHNLLVVESHAVEDVMQMADTLLSWEEGKGYQMTEWLAMTLPQAGALTDARVDGQAQAHTDMHTDAHLVGVWESTLLWAL